MEFELSSQNSNFSQILLHRNVFGHKAQQHTKVSSSYFDEWYKNVSGTNKQTDKPIFTYIEPNDC